MTRVVMAAVVLSAAVRWQGGDAMTPLDTGRRVERSIPPGARQSYTVTLNTGEFAAVTVEQLDVDVSVDVLDPAGGSVASIQDEYRPSSEERFGFVAATRGAYTITVTAPAGQSAGSYAICVIDTHPAGAADRIADEVLRVRSQASRVVDRNPAEATRLLEGALARLDPARPDAAPTVALLERDIASTYLERRDYEKAQALYPEAIAALERTFGADHPATASAWARLALLYLRTGQRPKAEKLLPQALDVLERTLGPDHIQVAKALVVLGTLRSDTGDLQTAEAVDRRALRIVERNGAGNTLLHAALLNNIGLLDLYRRSYDRADQYFAEALAIAERIVGPDDYWLANTLQNRGIIARQRRDYAGAQEYYLRALAIRERHVGPDHPDVAANLTNIANIYSSTGDYARSIETHARALHIWERTSGPYTGSTIVALGNLARAYAAIGDLPRAIAYQRRTDAALETQLTLNLAIGSERQKVAFVASLAERTDRTVSLSLNRAPDDAAAGALAALVVLQRKGRVFDAMADTLALLRAHTADPEDRRLLDELSSTTSELARLALNGPPQGVSADEHRAAIARLEVRKESLETHISAHSAAFRASAAPVTLAAVQGALPDGAALVEFAVFRPFDPTTATPAEGYGEPHYAAFVLARVGAPRGLDLGPAAPIDAAVERLRAALANPARRDVVALARALDEQVLRPVRAVLPRVSRLLISPDGQLNLVPFEALRDERGRYTIDRYAISYLTSGRDLLRLQVPRPPRATAVVVADPAFGEPSAAARGRRASAAHDRATVYFPPLTGTAQEARAIHALFPRAMVLTGRHATKAAVTHLESPRILHLASHGFFLQDGDARGDAAAAGTRAINAAAHIDNPLLRSGIALAGANLSRSGSDSGILTALEAANLNLWGTKLVTLSACDTGVGEVRNGEGVYGLRRAFFLAGTETLVMSLWPVSDYVTREMMGIYYSGLRRGLGRGDALRHAQRAMRARPHRQHPFYWASFIQAGQWTPLDPAR